MDLQQGSAAWHAARREKLTASNFAAACGINPWKSRARLWAELSGIAEENNFDNPALTYGHDYEPLAVSIYKALNDNVDIQHTGLHEHKEMPFLAGSPDGLIGNDRILEVKCPYKGELYDSVPTYYMTQLQGLLDITGRDWAELFCFTPLRVQTWYVRRDERYIELMRRCLHLFWMHVKAGTPPEPYSDRMKSENLSEEQAALREFKSYALL
eukprot:tig00000144_g9189.t1